MRLGITHARFASAEFARPSLIHSLRNRHSYSKSTDPRGNRLTIEALSVIIIIIITNIPVATLRCLLLIASTTATSLFFPKQYSCRARLCLSRFALRDATFAGGLAFCRSRRSFPHSPRAIRMPIRLVMSFDCTANLNAEFRTRLMQRRYCSTHRAKFI